MSNFGIGARGAASTRGSSIDADRNSDARSDDGTVGRMRLPMDEEVSITRSDGSYSDTKVVGSSAGDELSDIAFEFVIERKPESPQASLEASAQMRRATGDGFIRNLSEQAGRPEPEPQFEASKTELAETAGTVNTSWWKHPGTYTAGAALAGAGLAVAGLTIIGLAVVGGAVILGGLAWGIGKKQSRKAAARRAQQVEAALQTLRKQGVVFSEEDFNRLRRLSPKDWKELLDVPRINVRAGAIAIDTKDFDYRQLIRERAILDVAKNENVRCGDRDVSARQRRRDAARLIRSAGVQKMQMLGLARRSELPKNPALLKGLLPEPMRYKQRREYSHTERDPIRWVSSERARLNTEEPVKSVHAGPKKRADLRSGQPSVQQALNTANPSGSDAYYNAYDKLLRCFTCLDVKSPLDELALTNVKDKAEIERVNRNLANAILAGAQVPISRKPGYSRVQEIRSKSIPVAELAAQDPRRFAALFDMREAGQREFGELSQSYYDSLHLVLYEMAVEGHSIEELEHARQRLTAVPEDRPSVADERVRGMARGMAKVLDAVSDGEPIGRAMGLYLDYGYERGREGWSSCRYEAVERALEFLSASSDSAKTLEKQHPAHQEALTATGLSEDTAAHVVGWVGTALGRIEPQAGDKEAEERMKELLELKEYADRSARSGFPYIDDDDSNLPDLRKDMIRAILYTLGTANSGKVVDAGRRAALPQLAEDLCGCSDSQLRKLLEDLNKDISQNKWIGVFDAVQDWVTDVFLPENEKNRLHADLLLDLSPDQKEGDKNANFELASLARVDSRL